MIDDHNFYRFTLWVEGGDFAGVWVDQTIVNALPVGTIWVPFADASATLHEDAPPNLFLASYLFDATRLYLLGRMNTDEPMLELFSEEYFSISWEQAYLRIGGCFLVRGIPRPTGDVATSFSNVAHYEVCLLNDVFDEALTLT